MLTDLYIHIHFPGREAEGSIFAVVTVRTAVHFTCSRNQSLLVLYLHCLQASLEWGRIPPISRCGNRHPSAEKWQSWDSAGVQTSQTHGPTLPWRSSSSCSVSMDLYSIHSNVYTPLWDTVGCFKRPAMQSENVGPELGLGKHRHSARSRQSRGDGFPRGPISCACHL